MNWSNNFLTFLTDILGLLWSPKFDVIRPFIIMVLLAACSVILFVWNVWYSLVSELQQFNLHPKSVHVWFAVGTGGTETFFCQYFDFPLSFSCRRCSVLICLWPTVSNLNINTSSNKLLTLISLSCQWHCSARCCLSPMLSPSSIVGSCIEPVFIPCYRSDVFRLRGILWPVSGDAQIVMYVVRSSSKVS